MGDHVVERGLAPGSGRQGEGGERRGGVVDGVVRSVDLIADDEGEAAVGPLMLLQPRPGAVVVEGKCRQCRRFGL